uniref:Ion transport domain-containing protein n=1 Tax=Bos indicus x Bos taurus TaxID=30522 RepID=A0A4W2I4W5_BOBOX
MTFLLMLLLIFFYIFAVAGVYFFENYTRSTRQDLEYHEFFSDLLNSIVTVFILFTLDHWYALLQDTWKVPEVSRTFSSIYVILWLLLGSIIFRNIIVAMMVTNFQNIRNELNEEMTHLEVQHKADIFKRQIIQSNEISLFTSRDASQQGRPSDLTEASQQESKQSATRKGSKASKSRTKSLSKRRKSTSSFSSSSSSFSSCSSVSSSRYCDLIGQLDWETHVHQNLPGLMDMDQDERVVWPRDSLFRYFELLEKLQYNLEERKQLQEFAGMPWMLGFPLFEGHLSGPGSKGLRLKFGSCEDWIVGRKLSRAHCPQEIYEFSSFQSFLESADAETTCD